MDEVNHIQDDTTSRAKSRNAIRPRSVIEVSLTGTFCAADKSQGKAIESRWIKMTVNTMSFQTSAPTSLEKIVQIWDSNGQ